jgi:hypothetical protein
MTGMAGMASREHRDQDRREQERRGAAQDTD